MTSIRILGTPQVGRYIVTSGPYEVAPDNQPVTIHGEATDMPSADEPTNTTTEAVTVDLRAALTPFPVEALDYRATEPGCILDATLRPPEEIALYTVRYAIATGIPAEEFGTEPTESGTPAQLATTSTFRELFGMNSEWWEVSSGSGNLWLTEDAYAIGMHELLYSAETCALDWLNGYGTHDDQWPGTRCHPTYTTTHSYLHDADGLYLYANDVIA